MSAAGLSRAASDAGIVHQLQRVGSMLTLFFIDRPVLSWNDAKDCDRDKFSRYFWGLVHRGGYMPCSQFEAIFFSVQHIPELIDQTITAARGTAYFIILCFLGLVQKGK